MGSLAVRARTRSRALPTAPCRGTSLVRNCLLLGPYSMTMPKALWWPWAPQALSWPRDTSLVRVCLLLGPYSRAMPRALRCS